MRVVAAGGPLHEAASADDDLSSIHAPLDARARRFPHALRRRKRQAPCRCRLDQRSGDDMSGRLIEARGGRQNRIRRETRRRPDIDHGGLAVGQRAGLVQNRRADTRQHFEHAAVLDENADPCRARHPGNDGDRNGKDERTGRRDDEHGKRPDRVPRPVPGGAGYAERHDQKAHRKTVGHAGHRRLAGLRGLDQAHDPRVGAFGSGPARNEIEGRSRTDGTAQGLRARQDRPRHRLPRQGGHVERCRGAGHDPVHRQHFALPDEQPVAGPYLRDRDLLEPGCGIAHGGPLNPAHQRRHLTARAAFGKGLEQLAAGIHQADDVPGKRLAECDRRGHRQRGDDIEPDIAPAQGAEYLDEQAGKDHQRRARPHEIGMPDGLPRQGEPDRKPSGRDRDQDRAGMTLPEVPVRLGQGAFSRRQDVRRINRRQSCPPCARSIRGTVLPFRPRGLRLLAAPRRAEGVVQGLHDGANLRPDDRVVDGRAFAARLDKAVRPQPHELLRHRHLLDGERVAQVGDRALAVDERAKDQQPLRVREAAHQVCGHFRRRDHFFYIHVLEFIILECYMQAMQSRNP